MTTAVHRMLKSPLDVAAVRADFPILGQTMNGKPLVFLDNAASSQKPRQVINALEKYYSAQHANVHRGVYALSAAATDAFEAVREQVRQFINARSQKEIIFTRGATESINLVAHSYCRKYLRAGDEILITAMEHHSNIVPWQMACETAGAHLKFIPISDRGELELNRLDELISERTKLIALVHISNTLGTINPVKDIIARARNHKIPVLVDGAQAAPHLQLDMQDLDADFYAISSHKMFGPTGIGILYGKEKWLDTMPPYQGGGEMISRVTLEKTTYNELPFKFEAGTPNIADVIGLGAAIEYLQALGQKTILEHETQLLRYATERLENIEGLRILGTAEDKASVISFLLEGLHPYDVGTLLDQQGIAVRTGHHCTEPIMDRFGIPGTIRASFAFYNTIDEIDALVGGIEKAKEILQ